MTGDMAGDYDRMDEDEDRRKTTCSYCGSTDVYWKQDANKKWMLYDLYNWSDHKHHCKKKNHETR